MKTDIIKIAHCIYVFKSGAGIEELVLNIAKSMDTNQFSTSVIGFKDGDLKNRFVKIRHSLRRTKASEIYRKTGNLRAVQLLLGHTKVDSTVRYLGVELEDALSIAERIDI